MIARPPFLLSFLVLFFTAATTTPAAAFCRMSVGQGQECCDPSVSECVFLTWQRRCMAVSLEATDSSDLARATVETIIRDSFFSWTSERRSTLDPGFEIQLAEEASRCSTPEFNTNGGNTNTIAFIRDWAARENDPSAFALSTVWHNPNTGEILDVDMEFNEDRGPFGICPELRGCRDGTVDLENVLTHEAGHFFGIGHSLEIDATMFASSSPGDTTRRSLTEDDRKAIDAAYPDGTLPDACVFVPLGGSVPQCGGGDGCSCRAAGDPMDRWATWALSALLFGLLGWRQRSWRRRTAPSRGEQG